MKTETINLVCLWNSEHRWLILPAQWREVDSHLDSNSRTKQNTEIDSQGLEITTYLKDDFEMWCQALTWQRPFKHGQRSQVHILVSQTLKKTDFVFHASFCLISHHTS